MSVPCCCSGSSTLDRGDLPPRPRIPDAAAIVRSPESPRAPGRPGWDPALGTGEQPRFCDAFCRRFHLPVDEYAEEMLRRSLSRRAILFAPLIRWIDPQHFALDKLFIVSIGLARNRAEFKAEVKAFCDDAVNRHWSRRWLKLRLSGLRLFSVAGEVLPYLPVNDQTR